MDGYIANFDVRFHVFDVDQASSSFSGSSSNFQIRFAVAQVGLSSIELIQPLSGRTIYSAHLKKHGSGMHHIGRYVADLPKATSRLKQRGYEVLMEGRIQGLGQFAYFAVPDLHCVIELLQLSRSFPLFLAEKGTIYTG